MRTRAPASVPSPLPYFALKLVVVVPIVVVVPLACIGIPPAMIVIPAILAGIAKLVAGVIRLWAVIAMMGNRVAQMVSGLFRALLALVRSELRRPEQHRESRQSSGRQRELGIPGTWSLAHSLLRVPRLGGLVYGACALLRQI